MRPKRTDKAADMWFAPFFVRTAPRLRRFLRRYFAGREDAEDVAQEAYLRVFEASAHGAAREPVGLLFVTARNLALSNLRRRKVRDRSAALLRIALEPQGAAGPADHLGARQDLARCLAAIAALPPKCRDVFVLRQAQELSHREIAKRLSISVSSVEKHLARALRLLRDHLRREASQPDAAARLKRSAGA